MATAHEVLDVARSQLGVKEDPPGTNRVAYTAWYGLVGAWCAMFVSWVAAHAKAEAVIPRHAWTPSGASWFRSRGQWGSEPRVGAIVYFTWPGMNRISHVGIVEAVNADGTITTIEGNTDVAGGRTGGQVMRQRRRNYITGYGYPAYDGVNAVVAPPAPQPAAPVRPAPNRLEEDGELGPLTIRRWQEVMGTPVDGVISRPSMLIKAVQTRIGMPSRERDGIIGPKTIAAIQRYLGTPVDGKISTPRSAMVVALQRRLNQGRF